MSLEGSQSDEFDDRVRPRPCPLCERKILPFGLPGAKGHAYGCELWGRAASDPLFRQVENAIAEAAAS